MTTSICITGATGFIGRNLVELLVKNHHKVTILVRDSQRCVWAKKLPVNIIVGDLNAQAALEKAVANQDYVIHVAGLVRARRDKEFYDTNVKGTQNLINAIELVNPSLKKFIFISSLEAGGPSWPLSRTERMADNPVTHYGKSKLEAENLCRNVCSFPYLILRPPLVFGPGDHGLLELFKLLKYRLKLNIGLTQRYVSCIYVDDLSQVVRQSLSANVQNELYYTSSDDPISFDTLHKKIAKTMGHNWIVPIWIPQFIFKLICMSGHVLQLVLNKVFWLNRTRYITFTQKGWCCNNSKLIKDFSEVTFTPFDTALATTYGWYKKNGWL